MTWNSERREKMRAALALMCAKVPEDTWVELRDNAIVAFQGHDQAGAATLRALFPGVFWRKHFCPFGQWWEYRGAFEGVTVLIYNVNEAPPTCKKIITTRLETERVAVEWQTREVEKETITWDCGKPERDDGTIEPEAEPSEPAPVSEDTCDIPF